MYDDDAAFEGVGQQRIQTPYDAASNKLLVWSEPVFTR